MNLRNFLFLLLFISAEASAFSLPKLIPYRKGELWGYCDSTKKLIIPPQFEDAQPFKDGRAIVRKENLDWLIDTTGKFVSKGYERIVEETYHGKYIAYDTTHKPEMSCCGLIDRDDKVIIPFFEGSMWWESDRYLKVFDESGRRSRAGIRDTTGRLLVPFVYEGYDQPGPGEYTAHGLFIMKLPGKKLKLVVVDTAGRMLFPGKFGVIHYKNGVFEAWGQNQCFYFDLQGKPVPPPLPVKNPVLPGYSMVELPGGKKGLVPDTSRMALFTGYHVFPNGAWIAKGDGNNGIVNAQLEFIVLPVHRFIAPVENSGLAGVTDRIEGPTIRYVFLGYVDMYGTTYWED